MHRHKLELLYPALFDSPRRCGCYVPSGWDSVLLAVCALLNDYRIHLMPELRIEQIKEKFGSLRIYTTHNDEHINAIIRFAQALCNTKCACCGQPGCRKTIRGVVSSLCDEHTKIEEQRRR